MPIFAVALLYFLTGKLSLYYTIDSMIVTISVFFPEGFALAAVLLFGRRVIIGIFIGQFFLALFQDFSFLPSFCISIGNSFEALIAYTLFKKVDFDTRMLTVKDIYIFIGVVVFILQPFSALCGTFTLYHFGVIDRMEIATIFFSWWFGNIMGQLLLTPFLLYFYHNFHTIKITKLLLFSLLFGFVCYAFIYIIPVENTSILFSITIVPLVMLLAYRNGMVYALSSIVVITLIAIYTANNHIGPFSVYDERTNLINLNFYILAHILIVLVIGVLFIEKNRALHELYLLNRELENRVVKEVQKNREKDRMLFFKSRLAQMGEMLSLIVHQWKQPLNNLSLIHQTLYMKYQRKKLDTEVMESFYKDAKQQVDQMSEIMENFKDFFKPHRKKSRFCLNDVISQVTELLKPALEHTHINVAVNAPERVFVSGYPNEFGQAILNIINNAKDALIENDTADRQIIISVEKNAGEVVLTIRDNGGGIAEEHQTHIFDPYFSTKEEKEGTGLGLYMAKMIIEGYMDGKITALNDSKGAVFKIVL